MKKVLIVMMLLFVVGCAEKAVQTQNPMAVFARPEPAWSQWKEKYGDDDRSVMAFNMVVLDRIKANHADLVSFARYVTDVNDPNSMESKLKELENNVVMYGDNIEEIYFEGGGMILRKKDDTKWTFTPTPNDAVLSEK